ncbi:CBS domain-containing protein [Candidatus Amarolinea dominans]|uniref:CBS domain-containing protein n=1 Tax=Candidatus Amarolinea dominans TaxID=3140696 RepID=UPI003135AFFF|nr:hypothetical protein [Anaerolineae bacterium]
MQTTTHKEDIMQARDVMTTNVVIVQASTPIADIAHPAHRGISGVPVFEGTRS